jgi:hypothetical protein
VLTETDAADNLLACPSPARLPDPNFSHLLPLENVDQAQSLPRQGINSPTADPPLQAEPGNPDATARKPW